MQSRDSFGMQLMLAVTLWVYQLLEKSENIPYNYVHSQERSYKKNWLLNVRFQVKICDFGSDHLKSHLEP